MKIQIRKDAKSNSDADNAEEEHVQFSTSFGEDEVGGDCDVVVHDIWFDSFIEQNQRKQKQTYININMKLFEVKRYIRKDVVDDDMTLLWMWFWRWCHVAIPWKSIFLKYRNLFVTMFIT